MIRLSDFILEFDTHFGAKLATAPWKVVQAIREILAMKIKTLSSDFDIRGDIAIHKTAVVEDNAILKGPLIISENCFVAAHAYLRNGVYLAGGVSVGPGCEVKSSFIFSGSALAHFNFVGDSLIGSRVNMEAGAVIANHFNERSEKEIEITIDGERVKTGVSKFGALAGDRTKIGANAVLSPGTVLLPDSIVKRLQLIG